MGRKSTSNQSYIDSYSYGFNGQETDDEWLWGAVSFEYRVHDPRLGRFLSVDPLYHKYPELTPYQFASNNPIWLVEIEGLEGGTATDADNTGVGAPVGTLNSVDGGNRPVTTPISRDEASDIMNSATPGIKLNNGVANQRVVYDPNFDNKGLRGNLDGGGGQKGAFALESAGTVSTGTGTMTQNGNAWNANAVGNPGDPAVGGTSMWAAANSAINNANANAAGLANAAGAAPAPGTVSPTGTTNGGAVPSLNNAQTTLIRIVVNGNEFNRNGNSQIMQNARLLQAELSQNLKMRVDLVSENSINLPVNVPRGNIAVTVSMTFREF